MTSKIHLKRSLKFSSTKSIAIDFDNNSRGTNIKNRQLIKTTNQGL